MFPDGWRRRTLEALDEPFDLIIIGGGITGCGILLDHATGVVIGETAVVGNDVSIMQSVTLGGTGKESGDRHPKVGSGVLIGAGAKVKAFDPVAMDVARRELPEEWFKSGQLALVDNQYDAIEGADALLLVTEWKPFRNPDFTRMKGLMSAPVIFDGRNQYDPLLMREIGFEYTGIGRRGA